MRATASGLGRDALLARLDRSVQRLRRLVTRPPDVAFVLPGTGRTVDLAKLLACGAVWQLADAGDDPVSVKDVSRALDLEHSTTSRLLAECESEGLLRRSTDSGDRRRTLVELTDLGTTALDVALEHRSAFLRKALGSWRQEDLDTLVTLFERFADDIVTTMHSMVEPGDGGQRPG